MAIATPAHAATLTYHRAPLDGRLALALAPVVGLLALGLHVAAPGWWVSADIALALAATAAFAALALRLLGLRSNPHTIDGDALDVHVGRLWSAHVPLREIARVRRRSEVVPGRLGLVESEYMALLAVGGRVDLLLELRHPVLVHRPLGPPVLATRLAIAADDPQLAYERLSRATGL